MLLEIIYDQWVILFDHNKIDCYLNEGKMFDFLIIQLGKCIHIHSGHPIRLIAHISEKFIIVNENNNMEWVTSWQSEADIQPGIG